MNLSPTAGTTLRVGHLAPSCIRSELPEAHPVFALTHASAPSNKFLSRNWTVTVLCAPEELPVPIAPSKESRERGPVEIQIVSPFGPDSSRLFLCIAARRLPPRYPRSLCRTSANDRSTRRACEPWPRFLFAGLGANTSVGRMLPEHFYC